MSAQLNVCPTECLPRSSLQVADRAARKALDTRLRTLEQAEVERLMQQEEARLEEVRAPHPPFTPLFTLHTSRHTSLLHPITLCAE